MATATKYKVAGIVVEATKSEGGGFYDVTILLTGAKHRVLADVFETVAEEINDDVNDKKENPDGGAGAS